jgi:hypothetical protein
MTVEASWTVVDTTPSVPGAPRDGSEGETPATLTARDFAVDPDTGELLLVNGDLSFVSGLAAIRQEVSIRLRTFAGEWFLDVDAGLPYLTGERAPDLDAWRSRIRAEILAVLGVKEVLALELNLDGRTRRLRVVWRASTDLGALAGVTVAGGTGA